MSDTMEWQCAEGSSTMHVIDTSKPAWVTASGRRKRNGPRSACGRYPQRNAEFPWLTWPAADETVSKKLAHTYHLTRCPDCIAALAVEHQGECAGGGRK